VLHRDLKPGNILVRESDRQPIVVDFGHAYLFEEMSTTSLTTSSLVGTLGYIPSEVFANPRERSPLHDIFSCGVITYELVARRLPDPHDYHALANLDVQYASLDTVLIRALSAARLRFHSAEEFADALRNIRVQK
jgi:serine/threonine-protein kinase